MGPYPLGRALWRATVRRKRMAVPQSLARHFGFEARAERSAGRLSGSRPGGEPFPLLNCHRARRKETSGGHDEREKQHQAQPRSGRDRVASARRRQLHVINDVKSVYLRLQDPANDRAGVRDDDQSVFRNIESRRVAARCRFRRELFDRSRDVDGKVSGDPRAPPPPRPVPRWSSAGTGKRSQRCHPTLEALRSLVLTLRVTHRNEMLRSLSDSLLRPFHPVNVNTTPATLVVGDERKRGAVGANPSL